MPISLKFIFVAPFHLYPECGVYCPAAGMYAAILIVLSGVWISRQFTRFSIGGVNLYVFFVYVSLMTIISSLVAGVLISSEGASVVEILEEFYRWRYQLIELFIELAFTPMIYMLAWILVGSGFVALGSILAAIFKVRYAPWSRLIRTSIIGTLVLLPLVFFVTTTLIRHQHDKRESIFRNEIANCRQKSNFPIEHVSLHQRVNEVVAKELDIDLKTIRPESSFVGDLGADSLDLCGLIVALETELDIEMSDDAYTRIDTPRDVVAYIICAYDKGLAKYW